MLDYYRTVDELSDFPLDQLLGQQFACSVHNYRYVMLKLEITYFMTSIYNGGPADITRIDKHVLISMYW